MLTYPFYLLSKPNSPVLGAALRQPFAKRMIRPNCFVWYEKRCKGTTNPRYTQIDSLFPCDKSAQERKTSAYIRRLIVRKQSRGVSSCAGSSVSGFPRTLHPLPPSLPPLFGIALRHVPNRVRGVQKQSVLASDFLCFPSLRSRTASLYQTTKNRGNCG